MYNVGFGDCFLVEFPKPDGGVSRVLIDCGSTAAAPGRKMSQVVDQILSDVTDHEARKPRIDVVVCTHRHADHVSGFANEKWADLQVKEVWMPWTENPKDPAARKIRETQSALAVALDTTLRAVDAGGDQAPTRWQSMAANALTNHGAMDMLHEGFKSRPRPLFLSSDGSPTPVETGELEGVSVFVLGPSKSEDVIRDMDPPKGKTYLRQLGEPDGRDGGFDPFGPSWAISPSAYVWTSTLLREGDQDKLEDATHAWEAAVAVALDSAVNGTSLVLAFQIQDVVLLFPGDAQWGTWNALLGNERTRKLLQKTRFWKVGHHGSHNATPRDFLSEASFADCCAMMSTNTTKFPSIPRQPLLDAIAAKSIPLARSDEQDSGGVKFFSWMNATQVEARIPLR